MEENYQNDLGDEVECFGGFRGVVVQRGFWESMAYPQRQIWYVVRSGKDEMTVTPSEIFSFNK